MVRGVLLWFNKFTAKSLTCGNLPSNMRHRKCYETVTAEQGRLDESKVAAEVFGIFKVVLIVSAAYNCLEWMKPQ